MIMIEYIPPFVVASGGIFSPKIFPFLESKLSFFSKKWNPFKRVFEFERKNLYSFSKDKKRLVLPKGAYLPFLSFLKEKGFPYKIVSSPSGIESKSPINFSFRGKQKECFEVITQCLQVGSGGLIVAPPAFGKSHIISFLCKHYSDIPIDIVTKRRDVLFGIYGLLLRNIPDEKIGIITSGRREKGRVTCYTADSLHHSSFSSRLLLLDEVHELVTDNYFRLLSRYSDSINLGFTATPNTRSDNLHRRILALCGPCIFNVEYKEVEQQGLVVPILVYWVEVKGPDIVENIRDPVERKRYGIWKNSERNKVIASIARKMYNRNLQVLILVETIEHALLLKELLPDFEVCYSDSAQERSYASDIEFSKISSTQREEMKKKFMNREIMGMIATGIWSVGVSFDSLNVLIRADASGSLTASIQAPGRVCRIAPSGDKEYGIVIDFMDHFSPVFYNKSIVRQRMYRKKGWTNLDAQAL